MSEAKQIYHVPVLLNESVDGMNIQPGGIYVDALETIRDRYSDVKIMAITHDDAMKARFGQAVTVIKTDDGSKVIY